MPRPLISIIIPTYNRPKYLQACLHKISKLHFPVDQLEVIIVNDGGEEKPLVGLSQTFSGYKFHTRANAGPAAARNAGAALANGKFLAFIDDDCQPDEEWLRQLAEQLSETPDCLLGGQTVNKIANSYSAASQLLVDYLYDYFNEETAVFFTSNNMAMRAKQFHELGGFDTTFPLAAGEDRDFCDKWRQVGHEMVYVPTAVVNHFHYLTFRTFWRQHFNYGRGAYHFHQLRRQRQQKRVKVEPIAFYRDLVLYPWRKGNGREVKLPFLMVVTQMANAAGFFYEKWVGKKKASQRLASTDN